MAKQAKLKPVEIKEIKKWRVNVPADLSETGARMQKRFDTKAEALGFCEQLRARKENFGTGMSSMSPAVIAKCAEAMKLLDPLQVDILDAVREYVAGYKRRNQSVTLEELFNECIASKSGSHKKYISDMRQVLNKFSSLKGTMVSDIETQDIEKALDGVTNGARNNALKVARTMFNFGIDRRYLQNNPVRRSSFAKRPKHDREIIPADKVSQILNYAWANNPEIIPYLVVTFFCGVRPEDEALGLQWADISDALVVRSHVSKTEDLREIPLSDNARAWLGAYVARTGVSTGRLMALSEYQLSVRRKAAYKAAGYAPIPQDAARHSFASYWLPANNNDLGGLLARMGHSDIQTLRNHYLRHATKEESAKFWSILPPAMEFKNLQAF